MSQDSNPQDASQITSSPLLQSSVILYQTASYIKQEVTKTYLASLDKNNPPPPPKVTEDLLGLIQNELSFANSIRSKETKFRIPQTLSPAQLADILITLHHAGLLKTSDADNSRRSGLPCIYLPETGLYSVNELDIHRILKD